jgi:hypothetical protein
MVPIVVVGMVAGLSWLAWSPLARTLRQIADSARRKDHGDNDDGDWNALLESDFSINDSIGLEPCLGKGVAVIACDASGWPCCARVPLGTLFGNGDGVASAGVLTAASAGSEGASLCHSCRQRIGGWSVG